MKRALQLIVSFLLAILALILAVSSCAPQSALGQQAAPTEALETAEPTPEATVEPSAEPTEEPPVEAADEAIVETAAPEPEPTAAPAALSMAEMTTAERAAFWGLPEPPEGIDLDTREFLQQHRQDPPEPRLRRGRHGGYLRGGGLQQVCRGRAFRRL